MENWVVSFLITILYTAVALYLGVRAKGKLDMNKIENWGVGGHTISSFMTFFLIGAASISAYTFMGGPSWAYSEGVPILYVALYLFYLTYLDYFIGPRVIKLSREHNIITMQEGLGRRYESKWVRAITAIVTSVGLLAYGVIQIKACGYIINIMSGGNVPNWVGSVAITVIIFIYLYTSGLRAIGWTNALQGIFMIITACALAMAVSFKATGSILPNVLFNQVLQTSPEHLILPGNSGLWTPMYWATCILGSSLAYWPTQWVFASSSKDVKSFRKTVNGLPVFYFVMLPMIFVGIAANIVLPNYTGISDQIALNMAYTSLPIILVGVFGAAMLAASQSSCEPMFQSVAMAYTLDVIGPIFGVPKEKLGILQRRLLFPVMFLIVLPVALYNPSSIITILLVGYAFLGQVFPLVIGTFVWPRSTKYGAIAGMFAGTIAVILFTWVWPDAYEIYSGVWGLLFNIPVHIMVSLATKPEKRKTIEKFFDESIISRLYETTFQKAKCQ